MSNIYTLVQNGEQTSPVNLKTAAHVVIEDPQAQLLDQHGQTVLANGAKYPFRKRRRGGLPVVRRNEVQA